MHTPQFYPGALLVDSRGIKYLVLSFNRTGHQYERYWAYSILSEGKVILLDDYSQIVKELNLIDTMIDHG